MDGLRKALSERILILDGAMGTMLQRQGLSGNNETFNLSHPDIVRGIHEAYIDAGADILSTNTFGANAIAQADYGLSGQAREFARAGAALARQAADAAPRKVWVAGSLGPTGKSLSLPQDLSNPAWRACSFDEMAQAYADQVRGLVEGGADALLLETCFDALNAKAALYAVSGIPEAAALPLIISVSVGDRSGRTLTGQTLEAFFRSVRHARPLCFGLNCSLGAADLAPLLADVAAWADCAVSCYPNAGLPNEMGAYDETPVQTAAALRKMAQDGLINLVGGCCGTTPDHIRAIAQAVRGMAPRPLPAPDTRPYVSGLEAVCLDVRQSRFTNIGERTNVAGSRKFAKLIAAGDYDTALQVAAGQIEGGASVIDVNMDDAMLDGTAEMEKFLRHIAGDPAVARAALMIDSSHWETLLAGLKNAQGRCIVNSLSLKEGEEVFLARAREIRRLGAAVVVMAFDEEGQATVYERKTAICRRAFRLLTEQAGFEPWDIIFDVNVLSVGTGIPEHARYAVDFIEAVRWIKANLPGALCSGGISNLSFAFRGNNPVREAMHAAFLYHAVAAGLDMGIVNPGLLLPYDAVEPGLLHAVEDVILDRDEGATERLIALAQETAARENPGQPQPGGNAGAAAGDRPDVSERLVRALVRLPVHDTQTGMKLFTRAALGHAFDRMLTKRFAFDLEVLSILRDAGFRIAEAPITLDFGDKVGSLTLRNVRDVMWDTLAIFYRTRLLGYYKTLEPRPMPESPPAVTAVIACPGSSDMLRRCVEALAAQRASYPRLDAIVLPDATTGEAWPEWVREIPTGKVLPSDKRNLGIREARGEIVAFLDDDARPLEGWLEHAIPYFSDRAIGAVGGPAVTPPEDPFAAKMSGRVYASPLVSAGARRRYVPTRVTDEDDLPSCNLLVRASLLREIGGYDTAHWPGEDTILCLEISRRARLVYDPWVAAAHHRRPLFGPHLRQVSRYARHRGYFAKRFPETSRRPAYFVPSLLLLGTVGTALCAALAPLGRLPAALAAAGGGVLALYLALALLFSFSTRLRVWAWTFAGIVATHYAYGWNFLRGLFARSMPDGVKAFDHQGQDAP